MLTKFRISAHDLKIERGRYLGLPVEERLCDLCKKNIEDEIHFMFNCPCLEILTRPFIKKINNICKHFELLSPKDRLIWLFSAEDKTVILILYDFIETLFTEKYTLLNVIP